MRINFGYVAISTNLEDSSPNKTVTLKSLEKLDKSKWHTKLNSLVNQNIVNTIRLLNYNYSSDIKVYRFTSKLVPLSTHPELADWDWQSEHKHNFLKIGDTVKRTGIRVSTHPDHYTLLNSPRKDVLEASIKDLEYHCNIFELMELGNEYKMVIHLGGLYKNKEASIERFYERFDNLDNRIKERITLENDDKLYNSEDILNVCKVLKIPMVLDIHHDICNPSAYSAKDLIKDIFNTWEREKFSPKIHLSSPKSETDFKSHNDYIDSDFFVNFLREIENINHDFDVMIEAKMKDAALFKLMNDISTVAFIKKVDNASIDLL